MNRYIPKKTAVLEEYNPNLTPVKIHLDANENPANLSPELLEKLKNALDKLEANRYPDPFCTELISAFSAAYGIKPENAVAGNGSDELISLIMTSFTESGDTVCVTSPDFSMYSFYAELCGCKVVSANKNDANELDIPHLKEIIVSTGAKIAILSNPCNPTGSLANKTELMDLIKSTGCLFVIDEAYMEFCAGRESVLHEAGKLDNLIVLKTLSKAFGMAAFRVGFAVSNSELTAALRKTKSPYNVNSFSQAAGREALLESGRVFAEANKIGERTRDLYSGLKEILCSEAVYPSAANFVFTRFGDPQNALRVYNELKKRGISIRMMNSRFLRFTCGSENENKILLCEVKKIYENG